MRSTSLFFAALVAVLSVGISGAVECELTSTTEILKQIDLTPAVAKCGVASGFSLNPPPGKPTIAQLDSLCAQESCRSTVSAIASMKLASCTISMLNGINLREIVSTISAHCSKKAPTNAKKSSDGTAILAGAAPGPAPATPSTAKKSTPPAATKVSAPPAAAKAPYPSSASGAAPNGSPSATTPAPVAAEATRKPNLRKNCHD